jgi:uncharacterized membrane protein HdeD (DUF308 family)
MSIGAPLAAVGLALMFSGLYRATTGARLFETGEDWALVAFGAATAVLGLTLAAKGV